MNKLTNPLTIVADGDFPKNQILLKILNNSKTIVACDGAANTLINQGIIPDIIIGDLDSLSDENKTTYSNIIVEIADQSQNDLRKAISYVRDNNINDITIIGATGKREDHTLGNIFSLLDYKNLKIRLLTDTGFFSCIHGSQKLKSFEGQQVSLFAQDVTIKVTSKDLKYNFNKTTINTICSATLNESTSDDFEILISHGSLLIFQTYK